MNPTQTFTITKRQHHFGVGSGEHGTPGYEWRRLPFSHRIENALYGVPLDALLGEVLGDGATIEVSVRIVKRRRLTKNPWLVGRRTR